MHEDSEAVSYGLCNSSWLILQVKSNVCINHAMHELVSHNVNRGKIKSSQEAK